MSATPPVTSLTPNPGSGPSAPLTKSSSRSSAATPSLAGTTPEPHQLPPSASPGESLVQLYQFSIIYRQHTLIGSLSLSQGRQLIYSILQVICYNLEDSYSQNYYSLTLFLTLFYLYMLDFVLFGGFGSHFIIHHSASFLLFLLEKKCLIIFFRFFLLMILLLEEHSHFAPPPSQYRVPFLICGAAEATGLGFVLMLSTLMCCQPFVSWFFQYYSPAIVLLSQMLQWVILLSDVIFNLPPPPPCTLGVMGFGAAEAIGLGFVCFVVINPCVLSANRVDFGLFFVS